MRGIVSFIAMSGWLATAALAAQSQPPVPSGGQESQAQQQQGQTQTATAEDNRTVPQQPQVTITINNQPGTTEPANSPNDDGRDTDQEPAQESFWTTVDAIATSVAALFTFILAIIAIVGAIVAAKTLDKIKVQAKATEDAAIAAKTSADAVMLAERAYLSITHRPPGVNIDENVVTKAGEESFGGWHDAELMFQIVNSGNTPARITDIVMGHFIDSPSKLPSPPSGPGTGEHLFLVKGDRVDDVRSFAIRGSDFKQLGTTLRLWMLGYVDYIDVFNIRRRVGYARYYDPSKDAPILYTGPGAVLDKKEFEGRNNLPFVTEPGYNYDRKRKQGEGNDWDEPNQ